MLGAPLAPSTAGQIARLISSTRPARRKDPFEPPPPSSSRRSIPARGSKSPAPTEMELPLPGENVGDAATALGDDGRAAGRQHATVRYQHRLHFRGDASVPADALPA